MKDKLININLDIKLEKKNNAFDQIDKITAQQIQYLDALKLEILKKSKKITRPKLYDKHDNWKI